MLDIVSIFILAAAFFRGYKKGIVVAICSFVGIILGMLCALRLSGSLAVYLMAQGWVTSAWAQIFAYALLFLGVLWLVRLFAGLIESALKMAMLGLVNRITGGILYAAIGMIIWSSVLWIGNRAHLIAPENIAGSRTYDFFAPIAPWVFAHVGAVLPFAKNTFADLEHFFDRVNQHLPSHVGPH